MTTTRDSYGYTWLVIDGDPADTDGLCTDLHAVNTTLADQGFATGLLCTVVVFADSAGRRVGLVYLYKQGTFYPFAPGRRRRPAARQPAGDLGPRRPRRRAPAREGPPALARRLRSPGL